MEALLLGPIAISDDSGREIAVPRGRSRVLLTALLVNAGTVVSTDALLTYIWGERLPGNPRVALQTMVARLRQAVGPDLAPRIRTVAPGYLFRLDPSESDLRRFEGRLREAKAARADGDWPRVTRVLTDALDLWRGEALAGCGSDRLVQEVVPALMERRFEALAWRNEAELVSGHHEALLPELTGLVDAFPLREQFRAQLMLALHRSGRTADALAQYRGGRKLLVEELGIEPGSELRELHRRILASDPALDLAGGRPPARAIQRQLPADLVDFVGREQHLKTIESAFVDRPSAATVVISGVGGVGKTTLALRAGHRLADVFPDGCLYANLRAMSKNPLSPQVVLTRFLTDLGMSGPEIPYDIDECAAMFRGLLSGRRMLIVLDDAADRQHILPLTPGDPGCGVLAVSRSKLRDVDNAVHVDVEALDERESRDMLARIVGETRLTAEPAASATLLAMCAGLPIAVRLVGAQLSAEPDLAVATLVGRLVDRTGRLAELRYGERTVRAAFEQAYTSLDTRRDGREAARIFRFFGLWPGAHLPAAAVPAFASIDASEADGALHTLTRVNLLDATAGHFTGHDLMRLYSVELGTAEDPREVRRAAIARLLDWYLDTADAAARVITPLRRHAVTDQVPAGRGRLAFGSHKAAVAWLNAEHRNLVVAVEVAAQHGFDDQAWRLPIALWELFNLGGYWADWIAAQRIGVEAARRVGDRDVVGWSLQNLGAAFTRAGRLEEAIDAYRHSMQARPASANKKGFASNHFNLGIAYYSLGRYDEAEREVSAALAIHREIGNRFGEGPALGGLGSIYEKKGDPARALEHHAAALAIHRELGDRFNEGSSLAEVAKASLALGLRTEALSAARLALKVNAEAGHQHGVAESHEQVGLALLELGDVAGGTAELREAHSIFAGLDPGSAERVADQLAEIVAVESG